VKINRENFPALRKAFPGRVFLLARRSVILVIRQFDLNSEKEWFVFVENQKNIQKVFLWKFKKKIKFEKKENSIK
jgi:hypothetical protein